jgi:hypothetical protein
MKLDITAHDGTLAGAASSRLPCTSLSALAKYEEQAAACETHPSQSDKKPWNIDTWPPSTTETAVKRIVLRVRDGYVRRKKYGSIRTGLLNANTGRDVQGELPRREQRHDCRQYHARPQSSQLSFRHGCLANDLSDGGDLG